MERWLIVQPGYQPCESTSKGARHAHKIANYQELAKQMGLRKLNQTEVEHVLDNPNDSNFAGLVRHGSHAEKNVRYVALSKL